MDSNNDIVLNLTSSITRKDDNSKRLPQRLPDGRRIDPNNLNLRRKMLKTHAPAYQNSNVFIPKHKLPVLDEFGISDSRPTAPSKIKASEPQHIEMSHKVTKRPRLDINQQMDSNQNPKQEQEAKKDTNKSNKKLKEKKEFEPKIIPKEVRDVAGGLPPSFPQHRIKKFTEEYHLKQQMKESDETEDEQSKRRRTTYVKGPNPRKSAKSPYIFVDETPADLEDLHPYIVSNLESKFSIKNLTKIQSIAMPKLLKTRLTLDKTEFIINSGVGSGKILTYVVPIVNNLALMEPKINRNDGIFALVLLPTRELAADVYKVFETLCRAFTRIVPGLLTGGERKKSEKARLRKGLNILITTPGRLIDHIEHSKNMDFRKIKYCVMGDAHRLIDPIREETSKKIAIVLRKKLPRDCVRCAATSTLTGKLRKFLDIVFQNPEVIDGFKEFED